MINNIIRTRDLLGCGHRHVKIRGSAAYVLIPNCCIRTGDFRVNDLMNFFALLQLQWRCKHVLKLLLQLSFSDVIDKLITVLF